jgi:hypothetical protein
MNAYVLRDDTQTTASDEALYRFRGTTGQCRWPKEAGGNLGAAGIWNFLWRLGIRPHDCPPGRLPDPTDAVLWISAEKHNAVSCGLVRQWVGGGGYAVAAGNPHACAEMLGWDVQAWRSVRSEHPYAALASVLPGRSPELLAPPGWRFAVCDRTDPGTRAIGTLATVVGERQTPSRATIVPLHAAPAMVVGPNGCFLNGDPFAGFQAWLQGQEELHPWLGWRHRLFWLDEWVSAMADVLSDLPSLSLQIRRAGIAGLASTTVVLRHDVDHSRDVSYLQEEVARGLTATHAVLRDRNTAFWRDTLNAHPSHEIAFHYTTGERDWVRQARAGLTSSTNGVLRPRRAAVSREGLLQQVQWARAHGVGATTLHRHLAFLMYPEWIEGMHTVFERDPSVIGSSSLFRAQVLRWGSDRVDGAGGTVGEWPDSQFPLWLPFKLSHAGRGGARLRGWESTSIMEPEPELVAQMLAHRIPHVPQRVLTLAFHPAHAHGPTFARAGSLTSFRQTLDEVARGGAEVRPLNAVYRAANDAVAG